MHQLRMPKSSPLLRTAAALLLAVSVSLSAAPASQAADWKLLDQANAYEAAGKLDAAAPLWKQLLEQFIAEASYDNAAMMAKNLGHYYDGVKDYEQAILYYELEDTYWSKTGKNWGAADMQRAEEIRLTLDVYATDCSEATQLELAAPKSGELAKFEPAYGAYIGLYSESDPKMGNYFDRSEQFFGRKHAIYLAYTQWSKDFPKRYAQNAKAAGGALQIAFEPDQGLDQVEDNDHIRQWARDAKAAGIPIFLRYASEMNGAWTKWSGDPAKYIAKWRLLTGIMREEAPNVAMVWSPGDVPRGTMSDYYPGDEYVDWVGVSLYTEPYEHGKTAISSQGISPVERLDEIYRLYADRKPVMISETAVAHLNHKDGKSWSAWAQMNLDRLYAVMPKKYPRLKAITYFNRDQGSANSYNDYLLRNDAGMAQAYNALIADPYFLSEVKTGTKPPAPQSTVKAEGTVAFAKRLTLTPYVKLPETSLGRVEYWLNGAKLGERSTAPYSFELDAGKVTAGSALEVRVYNSDGVKAGSRWLTLNPEVSVALNGRDLPFPEQAPVVLDGSTLAPVRAIFEAMGAQVSWDEATETATGTKEGHTVVIRIGSTTVLKDGQPVTLEVPAQRVNGYTMVPARFVGEAFGGKVDWEAATRTVLIQTKP